METNIKLVNKLQSLLTVSDAEMRHKTMLELSEKLELPYPEIEEAFSFLWLEELDKRVKTIDNPDLDFAQRLLKKEGVSNWLRNFISDKKDRDNLINQKMLKDEPVTVFNIAELKAMRKKRRSKYYITGLFQPGLYMVVAQAKTGKTLFGLDMGVSLMRGTKFLNRQALKSTVMILQNEEELSSTGAKIDNRGLQDFEREHPEEYHKLINSHQLIVVRNLDICTDRDKILEVVDQYKINCLIVDSFRASIAKSGLTELDLGAAMALYQLQAAIHERNMLGLVIHHANKADSNDSQTNALKGVGGHNSLIGANDGIVKLSRNAQKKHEGRETIDVNFYPRNDTPSYFNIHYNEKEACEWAFEVLDESILSEAMVRSICDILIALNEPYQKWLEEHIDNDTPPLIYGKSTEELLIDTGLEKRELVRILNYMDHNEAIARYAQKRHWIYHIPREGSDMYYLVEEHNEKQEEVRKFKELIEDVYASILATKSNEELTALSASLDEEVRVYVRKNAPTEVQRHILTHRYPPTYAVGDHVKFVNTPDASASFIVAEIVYHESESSAKQNRWRYMLKGMIEPVEAYEIEKVVTTVEVVAEVVDENDF